MSFHLKLPRNQKEFAIFLLVISVISVNIIAPLITCFEFGFHLFIWAKVLKVLPLLWLSVIILVLLTYKPAELLTRKLVAADDSFNAHMLANILSSVFILSILLTVIGTWIGCQKITLEPVKMFFHKWPRNFTISFIIELLIAQPAARSVMKTIHKKIDKNNGEEIIQQQ